MAVRKILLKNEETRQMTTRSFKMSDGMKLGPPTLRVKNLESVLAFYEKDFGLYVNKRYKDSSDNLEVLELGCGPSISKKDPILILKHDPEARKTPHDFAGLYHYAVLVPDRKSLASTYLAIGNSGVPYDGFADHTVSESLYLHDVERNGIEIYADRPKNTWTTFIELMKTGNTFNLNSLNKPLDFNSLLRELSRDERNNPSPFPAGARIGHMHLRVTNLESSVRFYHERLGLDVIGNMPDIGAAFLSVGGYHHHIGLNTWHSLGGASHREGDMGLENFKIIVPDRKVLEGLASQFPGPHKGEEKRMSIHDPDGIKIDIETE